MKSAASVAGKVPVLGKNLKFAIQLKGMKFGAPIAKGVAGGITGVFDIVDVAESADTLILCLRKREEGEEPCSDKEIRG
ncbi:MAG: hypothetical protein PG981_001383 [Wolbachia endosymbiont of Ctenocephalides orientis wCori]|nr:MAG: hypothetical protein PG981_001383 [Wolbachia endosymbiont of Ctenocephalides orientis wCori]